MTLLSPRNRFVNSSSHHTMADIEGLPQPKLSIINGFPFASFITKERIDHIHDAVIRSDDIFVATYPKCGTTWVQEIVWQILHEAEVSNSFLHERFPWYEEGPWLPKMGQFPPQAQIQKEMDALPSPRLMKTHLPFHLMPLQISSGPIPCKIIYVMRNPKDAAVSSFHHMLALACYEYDGTWNQFLPLYMAGRVECGSYYDHVLGWWSRKEDPNILFLKYEDMKKDLLENVCKVAEFLGKSLSMDLMKRIAKQCAFESMKANPSVNKCMGVRKPNSPSFIRKGEAGDWKNYFTEEQNKAFDEQYAERMKGTGLDFEWEIND